MPTIDIATLPIFDCDGHVTEPADLWTSRLPSKWGDQVPHTRIVPRNEASLTLIGEGPITDRRLDEIEMWFTGDKMLSTAAAGARAGWDGAFPSFPPTLAYAPVASYDAAARLDYLDSAGIAVQALYPNVGGFGSQTWRAMPDQDLALACVRAYNDFLIDWTSPAPERFVPIASIPFWDLDAAVAEIERAAAIGHRGMIFSGAPQNHDQPLLGDPHWDPMWAAAQANEMVVSFHLGSGNFGSKHHVADRLKREGPAQTFTRITVAGFLDGAQHVLDLLLCGVLDRFPRLKFFAAESGIGWLPFVLESMDYYSKRSGHDFTMEMRPSDYFRRQVYASFWYEEIAPDRLLDHIGEDNVVFETDFPHPSCLYPEHEVEEAMARVLAPLSDEVRRKVAYENACVMFGRDASAIAGLLGARAAG